MRMRASFFLIHLGSSFFLIHLGFSNMWWWWWQWRWWWRWEGGVEEGRCYFRGATGPVAVIPLACGRLELGLWPCGRLDTMVAGPVAVDMSCIATDPLGQRRLDPTATPRARGREPQSRSWEQRAGSHARERTRNTSQHALHERGAAWEAQDGEPRHHCFDGPTCHF